MFHPTEVGSSERRRPTIWIMWLAGSFSVAILVLYVASLSEETKRHSLQPWSDRAGYGRVNLLLDRGFINLFSDVIFDSTGTPRPVVVTPGNVLGPKVASSRHRYGPGLEYHSWRFDTGDGAGSLDLPGIEIHWHRHKGIYDVVDHKVWSGRVHMAIPLTFSVLIIFGLLLRWRVGRLRERRTAVVS